LRFLTGAAPKAIDNRKFVDYSDGGFGTVTVRERNAHPIGTHMIVVTPDTYNAVDVTESEPRQQPAARSSVFL
jgi:hypothetical protein